MSLLFPPKELRQTPAYRRFQRNVRMTLLGFLLEWTLVFGFFWNEIIAKNVWTGVYFITQIAMLLVLWFYVVRSISKLMVDWNTSRINMDTEAKAETHA
jgi:hypothetical protein